jgi:hypothetical protein
MRNALRKNKDQTYVDPGQAAAFEAIFGKGRDGPPNLPLSNKVVLTFEKQNPSICGNKAAAGVSRGKLDLTTFAHERGHQQENLQIGDTYLWDEELFCMQLKNLRGWSHQHAAAHWASLRDVPGTKRDNGGPGGSMRISIPANLVGASFDRDSKARTECATLSKKCVGTDRQAGICAARQRKRAGAGELGRAAGAGGPPRGSFKNGAATF